jgi:hypothetical protein
MGFPKHLMCSLESLHHDQQAVIRIAGETSDSKGEKNVRQCYILSPYPKLSYKLKNILTLPATNAWVLV